MRRIAVVHWRDACTEEAREGGDLSPDPLIDLHEVGWLLQETDDSISLGMELEEEEVPARWRLHIPKSCIVDMRVMDVDTFLRYRKRRSRTTAT